MAEYLTMESLIALVTLTSLEIVLGIDNIVIIAIITGRLRPGQRPMARRIGIGLALVARILLLLTLTWIMGLTRPLFTFLGHEMSGKGLIFLVGGLFLIAKSTHEIHQKIEGGGGEGTQGDGGSFASAIAQIVMLDIVFSLDSVITAVGMARQIGVMIAAVLIAVVVMLVFVGRISDFIEKHPTFKMLALAFVLLIGVMLLADGFGRHIERGYIYFAMAFSLGVEVLNMRMRKKQDPPAEPAGP